MSDEILSEFCRAYRGRHCSIQRRENDWALSFGDHEGITVESPWRIVQNDRIAHAGQDDRQKFGHPQPVDGETRANELLKGRRCERLDLDPTTADLRLHFDDGTRVDVFNASSGYEGWQATFRVGDDAVFVVGMGGGEVAIFRQPMSSRAP